MYLRLSKRSLSRSIHTQLRAVTTASILAMASATGALAQSASEPVLAEGELPPLTVETTPKKKAVKKRPTSEPQAAVTKGSARRLSFMPAIVTALARSCNSNLPNASACYDQHAGRAAGRGML